MLLISPLDTIDIRLYIDIPLYLLHIATRIMMELIPNI